MYLCTQPLKSAPHVGHSGSDTYPHAVRSLAQALQYRPYRRCIGAALDADHRPAWQLDVNRTSCCCLFRLLRLRSRTAVAPLLVTTTGSKVVARSLASPSPPRTYARRHLNTWFAFTPSACATRATLAHGSNVDSTIRRFSAVVRRIRGPRRAPVLSACSIPASSTYPLH
jgi:hypothetical protein